MKSITSNSYYEEYTKGFRWNEIFDSSYFTGNKIDSLGDGNPVIEWIYDDGELKLTIETSGEDDPALICDFNHKDP